ncbi:hypothetical protein Tco_1310647 [Tanacetum coccineum]
MPKYAKFLKGLLKNRVRLEEACMITMNERCSTVLLNKLPLKEKDPVSFTIPCDIGQLYINNALADLGASISLMPYTVYEKLSLREPKATRKSLELVDRQSIDTLLTNKAIFDRVHCPLKLDYPAIVYNDALTSNENVPSKPPISIYNVIQADIDFSISFSDSDDKDYTFICDNNSFSYKLISVNDLKPEPVNDHVEINTELCSENVDIKPMDNVVCISNNITPVESDECLETKSQQENRTFENKILMEHRDAQGQSLFTSRAWRCRVSWREFILGTGLHMAEEIESTGFDAYGAEVRDLMLRLCHRLIVCNIAGRSQEYEKVIVSDLFYLRGMDVGSVNIPYQLARYLRRFALGRKRGAMIFGGQFICDELDDTWVWVALGPERQPDAVAGALEVTKGASDIDEGAQAVLGLREVLDSMARDFSRFVIWTISSLSLMMDKSGVRLTRIDLAGKESTNLVKYRSSGILAHILNMENLPSKYQGRFSF